MPVTIPVDDPTVPVAVLLVDHEPPVVISVNAVVNPAQTSIVPTIVAGKELTVADAVV